MKRILLSATVFLVAAVRASGSARVTVDDLMRVRSILDVRISPDGENVAYAVSTPSLEKNVHEAAIFVVGARSGAPRRLAEGTRVFGGNLPSPRLRWSPDGASVTFLGFAGEKPQVFAAPLSGAEPRALTSAPEGVIAYE